MPRSNPFDKLRENRKNHADLTHPAGPLPRQLRPRPATVEVKAASVLLRERRSLAFRFSHEKREFYTLQDQTSVTTPERFVSKENLYPLPTGTQSFAMLSEALPSGALKYSDALKPTPGTYVLESTHSYTVAQKTLLKPRIERRPSNRSLFNESAGDYARRKGLGLKKNARFELCHVVAHRFLGNAAQEKDNIFVQTANFNSQQLVIENVISALAQLLGEIQVRQTCERFYPGNIGKRVAYELVLPGCINWCVEVRAEEAHVSPHIEQTNIHLNLIADVLMKSDLSGIRAKGHELKRNLKLQHDQKKRAKENTREHTRAHTRAETSAVFARSRSFSGEDSSTLESFL